MPEINIYNFIENITKYVWGDKNYFVNLKPIKEIEEKIEENFEKEFPSGLEKIKQEIEAVLDYSDENINGYGYLVKNDTLKRFFNNSSIDKEQTYFTAIRAVYYRCRYHLFPEKFPSSKGEKINGVNYIDKQIPVLDFSNSIIFMFMLCYHINIFGLQIQDSDNKEVCKKKKEKLLEMIRYALMKLKITKLTKKDFEVQSYSEMEFKKIMLGKYYAILTETDIYTNDTYSTEPFTVDEINTFFSEHKNISNKIEQLKRITGLYFTSYSDWIKAEKICSSSLSSLCKFLNCLINCEDPSEFPENLWLPMPPPYIKKNEKTTFWKKRFFNEWNWLMRGVFELQPVTYYTGNYTESYCQYLETLQVVTDLSEKKRGKSEENFNLLCSEEYTRMVQLLYTATRFMLIGSRIYTELGTPPSLDGADKK